MGKSVLTAKQAQLLAALSLETQITQKFYLTGGTALAEYYLRHRYSEDLDFFSEIEINAEAVFVILKKIKNKTGIKKIDFQQSFNRNLFFIQIGNEIIKTEFTYFPFKRIEAGKKTGKLAIDSMLDIAVNKLFTIYQNPTRARDFIDLYLLLKKGKWTIDALVKKAKIKFDWHVDPLQLGAQFLRVKDAKDLPKMIIKVNRTKWEEFFVKEAAGLKGDVLV